MTEVLPLDVFDLIIAATLVLITGLLSVVFRLGMERRLLVATLRTVVQLLLVGYALQWVFHVHSAPVLVVILVLMTFAAGRAAVARIARRYPGIHRHAFFTLVLSGTVTTFTVTQAVIGVQPWYRPQYVIPLLGMVLGNSLTGISLCLDHFLESLQERRELVEMELAHGASRWEAARGPLSEAIRRGMIPIINSMMVVGIVSLPGMMTGQILAGADPVAAVKYQIVVMFMIAAASSLGSILVGMMAYRRLFNERHQLRVEQIRAAEQR